MNKVLTFSLVN